MNHSPEGTGVRDALEEILRVHANDNIRPKAFYIASAALSAEPKATELTEDQAAALDRAFERMRQQRDCLKARLFEALESDPILKQGLEEVDHAYNISRALYSKVLDVACAQKARADEAEARLAALTSEPKAQAQAALASSGQAASAVPEGWEIQRGAGWVSLINKSSQRCEDFYEDRNPLVFAFLRALDAPTQPASAPARQGVTCTSYSWQAVDGKQHDTGRVTVNGGSFFADTASPEDAKLIAEALNAYATPAAPAQPRDAQAQAGGVRMVTLRSASMAINHVSLHNGPGRLAEATAMLEEVTPPAPRAPSIEPVGEALERLTLWARTQVGRCECTGDHPIADAERALGWRK